MTNGAYGWTYASRLPVSARKRNKKTNRYQKQRLARVLKLDSLLSWPEAAWGRIGRLVVMLLLIILSVAVLGKDRALRNHVSEWMQSCWQQARAWVGPAKEPGRILPGAGLESGHEELARPLPAEPLAVVLDKSLFVLDPQGVIWPLPHDLLPKDLPVITGLSVREEPGKMGMVLKAELNMELLRRLLDVPYTEQISEIHFGSREGVVLYTRDGIKVLLRQSRLLERDVKRLGAVIGDIRVKKKKIALVDLRYNQHVVVRPKRGR
ncbi:cell division protein FtsQ [candidate division FCPU426 bacterium]|nr:cell division protein FtsQ [candidate division FCPU426 bacterium]